jgi:hypothetical protein
MVAEEYQDHPDLSTWAEGLRDDPEPSEDDEALPLLADLLNCGSNLTRALRYATKDSEEERRSAKQKFKAPLTRIRQGKDGGDDSDEESTPVTVKGDHGRLASN